VIASIDVIEALLGKLRNKNGEGYTAQNTMASFLNIKKISIKDIVGIRVLIPLNVPKSEPSFCWE
jgi:ppGpp synthetase/RelA/SpoT-type nucleotidyltranferase